MTYLHLTTPVLDRNLEDLNDRINQARRQFEENHQNDTWQYV